VLKSTKQIRNTVEERDSKYPAWRRLDNHKINIPLMVMAATTILIPRFIAIVGCFVMQCIASRIIMIGASSDKPAGKWRRKGLDFCMWLNCATIMKICLFRTKL